MATIAIAAVVTGIGAAIVATSVTAGTAVAVSEIKKRKTAKLSQPSPVSAGRNSETDAQSTTATVRRRRNTAADTQPGTATDTQPGTSTVRSRNTTANSRCSSSDYSYTECGGLVCDMECMIIGSFGDELPSGVNAVPKASSKCGPFLPGVHQDLQEVQTRIRNDPHKTLVYTLVDFPCQGCLRPKQEYLQRIEDFLQGCKTPGSMIWYTGHGERGTGNWCFKDGVITFEEVFALYRKHFMGKLLYLHSDCCFSGNWIQRCAEVLDSLGIGACGHQAKGEGILMKIGAACLPDQIAYDTYYSRNGVAPTSDGAMSFWVKKEIGSAQNKQTALFMDFTDVRCVSVPEESCRLVRIPSEVRWSWKDITDMKDSFKKRFMIVTGTDRGRRAWFYVIVFNHRLEEFIALTDGTRTVNTSDYAHVVFGGWGQEPPAETEKLWTLYGPIATA